MSKKTKTNKKTVIKNPERTIGNFTFNPSFKGMNVDKRIDMLEKTMAAAKEAMAGDFESDVEYIATIRSYINLMIIQVSAGITYTAVEKDDKNGKRILINKFGGWCKRPNANQRKKISELVSDFCKFENEFFKRQSAAWSQNSSVLTADGENIDIPGGSYEATHINLDVPDKISGVSKKKLLNLFTGDKADRVDGIITCYLDAANLLELDAIGELIHKKHMIITWTLIGIGILAVIGAGTATAICLANRNDDEDDNQIGEEIDTVETDDDHLDDIDEDGNEEFGGYSAEAPDDFVPVEVA